MPIVQPEQISLSSLVDDGFMCVPIVKEEHRECIAKVMKYIGGFSSFRFPPIDEEAVYTDEIRDVFRLFFQVGVEVLESLLSTLPSTPAVMRVRKQCRLAKNLTLFTREDEPLSPEDPLSGTFFNLFHYDYGCLNTHRDRYLVTVICAQPAQTAKPDAKLEHSALWVRSPSSGLWNNIDVRFTMPTWVIFIGEELTNICAQVGLDIQSSEHCIRFDPDAAYISHSHHQPDPDSLSEGNRRSIALVLGERHG